MNEEAKAIAAVQTELDWRPLMAIYDLNVRLRGYNTRPSVNSACSTSDAARILRTTMPFLTAAEHVAIGNIHLDMAARALSSWSTIVNLASLETFGRQYQLTDYKISGIARDEYSCERKEQLRLLIRAATRHNKAALAHQYLAKSGRSRPPQYVEMSLPIAAVAA